MEAFSEPAAIRTALVGYGGGSSIVGHHVNQIRAVGLRLDAVVDADETRRRAAEAELPGVATYPSVEALVAAGAADLAVVVTPHNTHAELARELLRGGVHVCCEKPMALTTEACEQLIAEAERRDRLVTAYHNRHWDGGIGRAVAAKREGWLGDVVRVEARVGKRQAPTSAWRFSRSVSGGILYDIGTHFTEYALQLIDDPMTEVLGFATGGYWAPGSPWGEDTTEDEALAVVRFGTGAVFTLRVSKIETDPEPFALKVVGTEGAISFSPHGRYRLTHASGGDVFVAENDNPAPEWQKFYENLAGYLTGREALEIPARYALRPVHALDLAVRSAREGRALATRYG